MLRREGIEGAHHQNIFGGHQSCIDAKLHIIHGARCAPPTPPKMLILGHLLPKSSKFAKFTHQTKKLWYENFVPVPTFSALVRNFRTKVLVRNEFDFGTKILLLWCEILNLWSGIPYQRCLCAPLLDMMRQSCKTLSA